MGLLMNTNKYEIFTEESLDLLKRELIEHAAQKIPLRGKERLFLHSISEQILILFKKGLSSKDISDILFEIDMPVSSYDVHEYIVREMYIRMHRMELDHELKMKHDLHSDNAIMREIERSLQKCIDDNDGLFLEYQPQIDVLNGRIVGAEALVRWRYKGAIIQPSEFVNIAERSSLIHDLGEWILREASAEAKKWQDLKLGGDNPVKISINVSARQLNSDLPGKFNNIFSETGISNKLVGAEVTESFMINENSIPVLHDLKQQGISLSVDDFGTGFSSLHELKSMPFDTIKIDRSFVQNLETDNRSRLIIGSIIDMADKFAMNTLAEGVETLEQVNILGDMGCKLCQGFHFSEPLTSSRFIRFFDHGLTELHFSGE